MRTYFNKSAKLIAICLALFFTHSVLAQPLKTDPKTEQKIDSLLQIMTLEEKVGQLNQYSNPQILTGPESPADKQNHRETLRKGLLGSVLNVTGVQRVRAMQKVAVEETRLGIPLLFGLDIIHGYRTIFPIPLAQSCSWDLATIENSARISAIEGAAAGLSWTFAPMVDICRDPRWGRITEGAGEDPYLGSQIAAAQVRGFQGDVLSASNTIMACAKHFAAYGAAEAGRDYNTVDISKRVLHEIYLPPFKAALDAGAATFMTAFNELDGAPATGNDYLLRKVLKGDWGFRGFVLSDYTAILEMRNHGVVGSNDEAAALAMNAGTDVDMVSGIYLDELVKLVKDGRVQESLLDDAVRRVLRMKFKLGLFDDPFRYCDEARESALLLSPAHQPAARDMARKSIVLLKNAGPLLPLKKDIKTIAVIGPLAENQENLLGSWAATGRAKDVVTLLQGIKDKVSGQTEVLYAQGCDFENRSEALLEAAVATASTADAVILAVGEPRRLSGEAASRADLDLPGDQLKLVKAIHATGKPVVVVLMNGRPLLLNWINAHVPAIVEAWFLGTQAGNAIADVLFGDYNPSGKLSVSFPYAVGQIPVYYNHKNTGRPKSEAHYTSKFLDIPNEPLYPFGHGLSYTTFAYSEIALNKNSIEFGEELFVKVRVTNIGNRDGEEVVQLYTRDLVGSVTRPVKELKGFRKIHLKAGESREVEFVLTDKDLAFYTKDMSFKAEPGDFKIFVGASSVDVKEARFALRTDQ